MSGDVLNSDRPVFAARSVLEIVMAAGFCAAMYVNLTRDVQGETKAREAADAATTKRLEKLEGDTTATADKLNKLALVLCQETPRRMDTCQKVRLVE